MNSLVKYGWLIIAAVAASFTVIAASSFFSRHRLPLDEGALMMIILIIALSFLTAMALAIGFMTHRYVRPLRKLAEGTNLITSVNPSYRINLKGGREVLRLARIINEMAERFEEMHHDVRQMIQLAMAQTEEEKNILAAIVSELPEGILICNQEGQILLYNKQARSYLEGDPQNTCSDMEPDRARTALENRFIGLGRSVFGVIDKNLLAPAFDEIAGKLERKELRATAHFITRSGTNRLLRTEAVPILDHTGRITGFVLIFQDILKNRDQSAIRTFLPDVEAPEPDTFRNIMVIPECRPDFYDFDIFSQPGQTPEMDNLPLTDLAYTVFDTEATGLFPLAGDEIISLGAVRIVNSRLLREEMFNQLVNPQRQYWQHSVPIHGIQPEMLEGQPAIDKVLPHFHRFVEDSILVAHNAAFDMCLLHMKEAISGVKFNNPVLDTLLLSAIVHPAQDHHTLEAIAGRLGISVTGRHTALGDALVTGEILLKLIPLLAQMGITTLGEARLASQKTYYARFKY